MLCVFFFVLEVDELSSIHLKHYVIVFKAQIFTMVCELPDFATMK